LHDEISVELHVFHDEDLFHDVISDAAEHGRSCGTSGISRCPIVSTGSRPPDEAGLSLACRGVSMGGCVGR
jgi:hypothetical protein